LGADAVQGGGVDVGEVAGEGGEGAAEGETRGFAGEEFGLELG